MNAQGFFLKQVPKTINNYVRGKHFKFTLILFGSFSVHKQTSIVKNIFSSQNDKLKESKSIVSQSKNTLDINSFQAVEVPTCRSIKRLPREQSTPGD